ncbi:hypothetical protein CR513_04113, partial [Mucuna pruriens]
CLHLGQEECELSHLSMHRTWNPWLHFGKIRTLSPLVNSDKHITHSESKLGSFNSLVAFFFTPVLATLAGGLFIATDSLATKLEHLSAHLMMEFNPSEHIRAQSRTDNTMTTFASKFPSPRYVSVESWMLAGGFADPGWLSGE